MKIVTRLLDSRLLSHCFAYQKGSKDHPPSPGLNGIKHEVVNPYRRIIAHHHAIQQENAINNSMEIR